MNAKHIQTPDPIATAFIINQPLSNGTSHTGHFGAALRGLAVKIMESPSILAPSTTDPRSPRTSL